MPKVIAVVSGRGMVPSADWFDWADYDDDLRKRFAAGESAGKIAKAYGVTLGAATGRISRLGLSRKNPTGNPAPTASRKLSGQTIQKIQRVRAAKRSKPVAGQPGPPTQIYARPTVVIPALAPLVLDGAPRTVLTLKRNECCYPIGDPAQPGFSYCARRREDDRPYCADHVRLCYVKVRPRDPDLTAQYKARAQQMREAKQRKAREKFAA